MGAGGVLSRGAPLDNGVRLIERLQMALGGLPSKGAGARAKREAAHDWGGGWGTAEEPKVER